MQFKLGKNVLVGQQLKLQLGWAKITEVTEEGVMTKGGFVKFGETVFGWKSK